MLATLVQLVDLSNRRFFKVHYEGEPPPSIQVARPGLAVTAATTAPAPAEPAAPEMSSTDAMRAFFGGSVRYRGGS